MLNAFSSPQSVLVLGASSDIARAAVARLAGPGTLRRVVLAGRPSPARDDAEADARRAIGAGGVVTVVDFDATAIGTHEALLDAVYDAGDIDVVLVAFGVLPQAPTLEDPVAAAGVVTTNFTGAVSALTVCARRSRSAGHGTIVVLSSVAGERIRTSNFLYGATKAGLDAFATGLGDSLVGTGVSVVVIRPGFVRTRMTAGLKEAPLTVDKEAVAAAVAGAVGGPTRTVWVPGTMRPVMSALRHVPRTVFRRLPV